MARTQIPPTLHAPIATPDRHCIEGASVSFDDFSVTTDEATTAVVYLGGLIPWRLINESGGSIDFTFYDALSKDGTALAIKPSTSDTTMPAVTVADDASKEIASTAITGCTYLVIVGSGSADHVTLVCKR